MAWFTCEQCKARNETRDLGDLKCRSCGFDIKSGQRPARSTQNKYGAVKKMVDGITFDSTGESQRYLFLRLMLQTKRISNLECQVAYPVEIDGKRICVYLADFRYTKDGQVVVEDYKCKSTRTASYRIKKKAVEAQYGIKVVEIYKETVGSL